jgi:hypothetical protein
MCSGKGPQLGDEDEVLLRQIDPQWFKDGGKLSSQSFDPFRKPDENCLSTDRASLATPAESLMLFNTPRPAGFGGSSVDVYGVSVAEVHHVGLTAWEHPVLADSESPANPAHASIEFGEVSGSRRRALGKQLLLFAEKRGSLFCPVEQSVIRSPAADVAGRLTPPPQRGSVSVHEPEA